MKAERQAKRPQGEEEVKDELRYEDVHQLPVCMWSNFLDSFSIDPSHATSMENLAGISDSRVLPSEQKDK